MPIQQTDDDQTTTNPRIELSAEDESVVSRVETRSRTNRLSSNLAVPTHYRSLSTGTLPAELEGDDGARPRARSNSTHSFTFGQGRHEAPFTFGDGVYELDARPRLTPRSRLPRMSDLSINESRRTRAHYDIVHEAVPDATFFKHGFQTLADLGREIACEATTCLDQYQQRQAPQPEFDRLFRDAKKTNSFKGSGTRTIAVLGDSGEGKSSLVNSLLHFPSIAKASDAGMACTSVVTEYHQKQQHHTAKITIEVEYLSDSDMEEFIEELVWSYRQFFLKTWAEGDKDFNKSEAESETAWSALDAAFGHHGNLKSLFGDDSDEGLKAIQDKLLEWCSDLAWPEASIGGSWSSTAETADECCDKTAIFMSERLWPFTKVIRIYLDAQILQAGIVLADLPGLQDVNLAKVRATEKYLFKCDQVFVVARISRAISNQSLKNSLLRTLKNHVPNEWEQLAGRYMNLSIICTHSEDINLTTSRKDLCGRDKPLSMDIMLRLDQQIIQASKDRDKKLRRLLERKQKYLLIAARNDNVKAGLQRAYASLVPGGVLSVFCVSNEDYEAGCKKNDLELINASGIPALRRHCKAMTAEAQLLETRHFLESSLPGLLNSVALFVSSFDVCQDTQSEGVKADILAGIEQLGRKIADGTKKLRRDLRGELQEGIYDMTEHRIVQWEEKAHNAASVWMKWHHMSFEAFVRNNGTHSTFAVGEHRWNRDLIWSMRSELAQYWDWLEEQDAPKLIDAFLEKLSANFQSLNDRIQGSNLPSELVRILVTGLGLRQADARFIVGKYRTDFFKELSTIRRQASEDTPSSYVLQQMIPFYRAAAQERGTGKMRRQHGHVSRGIDRLFPGMAYLIKTALETLLGTSTRTMDRELQSIVAAIRRDFEMSYVPMPIVDEGDRERKEVLKKEIGELVARNEVLQRDLKEFLRREEESGGSGGESSDDGLLDPGVSVEVVDAGDVDSESGISGSESSDNADSESS